MNLSALWYPSSTPGSEKQGRLYNVALMVVLWPLSQLYRVITQTRRWLYRLGIFSSWKSPVPVVVVGNISVGGTGKTPLVIALVELLQTRGLNPGVVSRGYGGAKHERPLLVDNTLSPEECGDEPLLIARRTGQPVCVCAERSLAVQYLLSKKNVNIVVCDDGLQHYALQRDLEIAVVDHERQHGNQRLLPAGPLREPVARLRSVDFVVESTDAAQTVQGKGYYYRRILDQVERLDGEEQRKLSTFTGSRCHAVAGIGNPQRFFAHLQGLGIELITHAFPDHHTFKAADIAFPDKLPILMTEKDAVKCRLLSVAPERCWVVQLHAELSGNFRSAFLDKVESL